jgi:hypothetical protein
MGDIFKNINGGWTFLVSWVLPSVLFWSVLGLFIFPSSTRLPVLKEISLTDAANQTLVIVGAAILTGLVLNGLSTVLYRVLEGYYLPRRGFRGRDGVWDYLKKCQARKQQSLSLKLEALEKEEPNSLAADLVRERLQRYPADASQYGPTGFANAMRAFETYGWNRYQLDSQTLWSELISVAPNNLRSEQESARAPIDLSVSLVFLSMLTTIACVITTVVSDWSTSVVIVGLISLCLIPFWYRLAVLNTRYLSSVVRALVNVGRPELAKKLGLTLPATLQDERTMWNAVFWFATEPFNESYIRALDQFRSSPDRDSSGSTDE